MFILNYLAHWWNQRPRKLGKPNPNDHDLFFVEAAYEELHRFLMLKRKIPVYMIGKLNNHYNQNKGIHIYKSLYSVIFLTNTDNETIFYLAHEMFHEYQHEKYGKHYKEMTCEEREIEADGFAVAYCEYRGLTSVSHNIKILLPDKIDHVYFSDETSSSTCDGMPTAVRLAADKYFKTFSFDKKIRDGL